MLGTKKFGRLALVLAVVAGVVIGATVGQAGTSRAATTAVPKNKSLPTISGTAEVGQTLTATVGSWTNSPTSYHYSWSRCDSTGAACLGISGATAKIYTVTNGDVSHTLRVTVTARNSSGSTPASSAATPVVPPTGCPQGTGTIQVGQLSPPADLVITSAAATTNVTRSSQQMVLKVSVSACGRAVQGATVFASAVPYNQFAGEQGMTAADGTVTLTEARRSGFPASGHQHLIAIFVRATAPNQPTIGGVSARRLVSVPLG